ncbi:hypothetical protein RRG08_008003 [Elysia crispata]|uniref:Transmembrane protein n=1 Tax=Elysia crispata TaxID=231223 RepID=A0AAE1B2C6_9GAST|nr:hypothetical protein RRG08_008003 [Elysia crispata]
MTLSISKFVEDWFRVLGSGNGRISKKRSRLIICAVVLAGFVGTCSVLGCTGRLHYKELPRSLPLPHSASDQQHETLLEKRSRRKKEKKKNRKKERVKAEGNGEKKKDERAEDVIEK